MRFWISTLLFFSMLNGGDFSFAQQRLPGYLTVNGQNELVDSSASLRLFGSGIRGRKSDQNLAVACVGPDHACTLFRFVYFISKQEVYYIGPYFRINPDQTNGTELSSEKAFQKAMKSYRREVDGKKNGIATAMLCTLFVGGVLTTVATGGVLPLGVAAGSFVLGVVSIKSKIGFATVFDVFTPLSRAFSHSPVTLMTNRDGWDWFSKAKPVKEKFFHRMVEDLQMYYSEMPHHEGWTKQIQTVATKDVQDLLNQSQ